MYEPVKTFYMGSNPGEAPFLTKVGQRPRSFRSQEWVLQHLELSVLRLG